VRVRRGRRAALLTTVLALGCGSDRGEARPEPPARLLPPELTTRQLVGQHVVYPFAGRTVPAALEARIRRGEAAGVIFFARNLGSRAAVRTLTRRLQAIPRPRGLRAPLLLMVDQEGGPVKRLRGAPTLSAPEMGDPRTALAQGRATARTLRDAGMNVDLAPVLDTPRPGSVLDAEGRGFGSSAERVAELGTAFARGLERGGVAAAAKHFPGLGAAPRNTDDAAVRVRLGAAELRATDRLPFTAAVRAGVPLVMLSSAVYPALDPRPAVLSRRIATRELREAVGFGGVSISDDLQTPAFAAYGGASAAAVRATRAGVDLLLFAQTFAGADAAARAVAGAVERRRLSRRELRASAERVMRLRVALGS
jgi:beta-N-acetylhexosaminidase